MAHPFLEFTVAFGGGAPVRAERVTEVVEAQGPEVGGCLGVLVAAPERGTVEPATDVVGEDQVIGAGEALALEKPCERLRDLGHHRDGSAVTALGCADDR